MLMILEWYVEGCGWNVGVYFLEILEVFECVVYLKLKYVVDWWYSIMIGWVEWYV